MGRVRKSQQLLIVIEPSERIQARVRARYIRRLLTKQNRTIAELAKAIGVTPQYVSFWLTDRRRPSPEMRRRIMDQFPGREWGDLFEFVGAR